MAVVLLGMVVVVVAAAWGVNGARGLLTEDRQVRRP